MGWEAEPESGLGASSNTKSIKESVSQLPGTIPKGYTNYRVGKLQIKMCTAISNTTAMQKACVSLVCIKYEVQSLRA